MKLAQHFVRPAASVGRIRKLFVVVTVALCGVGAAPVLAADPVPPFIPPDAPWLSTVNYFRAMAGQAPVVENGSWSAGAYNHSCYMLYNGISHDELPGKLGYTVDGDNAGNKGNVAVSSGFGATARNHIELWMTGPFHAIGILRPNLATVGFGKCDNNATSPWKSAATLNVIDGLVWANRPPTPILWPGNGTTTSLDHFVTEYPNPLTYCGWTGGAGLPVLAMMPETVTSATASMTGPNGPVQTCRLFAGNTDGAAHDILNGDNAVTVIPRQTLSPGLYTVTVTTQARTVTWSFTVDPTAATGIMPIPTVTPAGPASHFTAIAPFRFADSRQNQRITKLLPNVPKRIKVAGTAGLPDDITAISANFTVAGPLNYGWITVYNCTTPAPTASTLNYTPNEPVANAGVFPLGGTDICVTSPTETQLIIDINGYFQPSSTNSYTAITPEPIVNTQTALAINTRLEAGSVTEVDFSSLPADVTAVALNITGIQPSAWGFITAFPCGEATPNVSNVNPMVNTTRQNFAIVPLSPDGTICFYTYAALDMRVDLLGYFTDTGDGTIVPTTPTRVIDTRDPYRNEMNFNLGGQPLTPNNTREIVLAGQRGIPTNAHAVSINLTAVKPTTNGTITIWGCGNQPPIITITYTQQRNIANGVQVDLSDTGSLCIYTTAQTHLIIDVTGYWN